jgi:hypothetical protein
MKRRSSMPYPRMSGAPSNAHRDCDEEIKESGPFMVAEALEAVRAALSVRVRNGELSVADGP